MGCISAMRYLAIATTAVCSISVAPASAGEVEVTWLGHATVRLVGPQGNVIVIDPYLALNPKAPPEYRDLSALQDTDLILVTHGHIDHISDLVPLAQSTGAPIVAPYEILRSLVMLGEIEAEQNVSLGKGGYTEPLGRGVRIHMVPAEHSSSIDLKAMNFGAAQSFPFRHIEGGEPVGYVIEFEGGPTVYHAGDTAVFGDMRLIGEFYSPDLALMPIGGTFTMGPESAAYAAGELLQVPVAIPIHFGTYPIINRTPAEFIEALQPWSVTVPVLEPGDTYVQSE